MARTVKHTDTRAINEKRQTVHGSHAKARLATLGGKAMGRDSKPTGFLSKNTRP